MKKYGWLHVDTHKGNIMCRENGDFVLIDFGWAVKKGQKNYPEHPLSLSNKKAFTYKDLIITQNYNLEAEFGIDKEKLQKSKREFNNIFN